MISVRNRLLPSSGNKWTWVLLMGLILDACSPRIKPSVKPTGKPVVINQPSAAKQPPKMPAAKVNTISVLLPFEADKAGGALATLSSSAILATDYYQGFKLALDSLTAKGYNYRLQVFDSKDDAAQNHSLALNPKIRTSDLIIGPVFPESIKSFTAALGSLTKPVVSPLSPASPFDYKSPDLVTVMPPLAYHAIYIAKFIAQRIKPLRVFILKSGYTEENKFILPFLHAVDSIGKKNIEVVQLTVVHGKLDALLPQLSTNTENVFVVPATDAAFLTVTLRALDKLGQTYPITLFGHPNWIKASYLQPELLQRLKTHVTTSNRIDYKSPLITGFIAAYKKVYHIEPGEYAMKGFDEGYYFGSVVATAGADAFKHLDQYRYSGLLNDFNFKKTEGSGWVNTHVRMLQYQNFDLKPVQ